MARALDCIRSHVQILKSCMLSPYGVGSGIVFRWKTLVLSCYRFADVKEPAVRTKVVIIVINFLESCCLAKIVLGTFYDTFF